MGTDRLPGLDALRGIAALCVVLFHARPELMGNAFLAVDFFFMLSGYVMARTYDQRFLAGLTSGRFLLARFKRLWPIMAVGGLLAAPMFAIDHPDLLPVIALNLLLIPTPVLGGVFVVNAPAWSVFFELFANAVHGRFLSRMALQRLMLLVAAAACALALFALNFDRSLEVGMRASSFIAGFPRVLMSYSLGILLWRWRGESFGWRPAPWLVALAMPTYFIGTDLVGSFRWPLDLAFVLVVFPLLIVGGIAWRRVPIVLNWLGWISFPLYAVHSPIMMWTERLHVSVLAGIAACLAVASMIAWADTTLRQRAAPAAKPQLA